MFSQQTIRTREILKTRSNVLDSNIHPSINIQKYVALAPQVDRRRKIRKFRKTRLRVKVSNGAQSRNLSDL